MLRQIFDDMTRARLIQLWCVAVVLAVVASAAFGVTVTASTGIMLLALCLAAPLMVLMLWPGIQPPTIAEVLRGNNPRNDSQTVETRPTADKHTFRR